MTEQRNSRNEHTPPAPHGTSARDRAMLDRAARAALRARGNTSPNPIVGCVIAARSGALVTAGHRRFGGPHAEAAALVLARDRGIDVRGATVYVTLEPCDHTGKTPPCARALVEAGVGEVVVASRDPNAQAAGGFATLEKAGIACRVSGASRLARLVNEPFLTRLATGRPWTVAKWAQTLDGKLAASTGHSKWITGPSARRDVHRLRARVDAIVTGIGTVLADDPLLTARGVPVRRTARRVVLDPGLETPLGSALVSSANHAPLTIYTTERSVAARADAAAALASRRAEVVAVAERDGMIDAGAALQDLAARHGAAEVLMEAGPTLLSSMLRRGLIDEAWAYVAPMILGDRAARAIEAAGVRGTIDEADRFRSIDTRRFGADTRLVLRRAEPLAPLDGTPAP